MQFRLLHRPEAELSTCDLGLMVNGQVIATPKLSVSKQRSALILGLKLSRDFVRENRNQSLNFAIPADSFFQVPGAALSGRE